MKTPSRTSAESLLVLTTAIWGSTFLIIKLMVTGDQANSPFALLTSRFVLAALVFYIIFRPKGLPDLKNLKGGLIIGIAAFGGYTFQTLGLLHTTPAKSGFITSLFILFVPLVSRLWEKVKIPAQVWVALIPAVFGLWAISGAGFSIVNINPGDKITLLSAFCYTFQIVGIQVYTKSGDWKWLSILQFTVIAAFSAIGMIFENPPAIVNTTTNFIGIAYLGVIATVGALGLQMFAQRYTTSARASFIYIAEPIFAALFAWLFAGHGMTGWELIGAGAILLSIIIGRLPSVENAKGENPNRE